MSNKYEELIKIIKNEIKKSTLSIKEKRVIFDVLWRVFERYQNVDDEEFFRDYDDGTLLAWLLWEGSKERLDENKRRWREFLFIVDLFLKEWVKRRENKMEVKEVLEGLGVAAGPWSYLGGSIADIITSLHKISEVWKERKKKGIGVWEEVKDYFKDIGDLFKDIRGRIGRILFGKREKKEKD